MEKIKVYFIQQDGRKVEVEVDPGRTLMEAARDYAPEAIDEIYADCSGCWSCATCHVIVEDDWIKKTGKIKNNSAEQGLLDYEPLAKDNSRLSCQIFLEKKHDGLTVKIPT